MGINKGEKNCRWNGGVSDYPNHYKLKKIRKSILDQYDRKCVICKESARLVHHIDFKKDNHNPENLILLCNPCHLSIHRLKNWKMDIYKKYKAQPKKLKEWFG